MLSPPPTFIIGDPVTTKGNHTGTVTVIILGAAPDAAQDESGENASAATSVGITHYRVEFVDHGRSSGRRLSEIMLPEQLQPAASGRRSRR